MFWAGGSFCIGFIGKRFLSNFSKDIKNDECFYHRRIFRDWQITCILYAEQGATVGICARRQNRLQIVEEKIKSLGGEAISFILDVADQEACQMAIEQFLTETESIDIVIANAGIGGVDDISSGSPSTMNKILSINILGVTIRLLPLSQS